MMIFEVAPPLGFASGLQLGQSLGKVVTYFKSTCQKSLTIQHSASSPIGHDIKVLVSDLGMELFFDPALQVLTMIKIANLTQSSFSYSGTMFCTPTNLATFHTIYSLFGPTFPGKLEGKDYSLQYRGIHFIFEIPEKFLPLKDLELPLLLPDGTSPTLKSFTLITGKDQKVEYEEAIVLVIIC